MGAISLDFPQFMEIKTLDAPCKRSKTAEKYS